VLSELRGARAVAPAAELRQFASVLSAHQYRLPWALTESLLAKESDVLDWGCGDGHFSYFLLRAGHRVTSYSLQHPPFVLQRLSAELSARSRYVQGRLEEPTRLPFEDEAFDAVASVGVLEHVRETGGTEAGSLAEIRRVLRPGGLFLCFHLPNRFSWIEALAGAVGRGHHEHRYSGAEVAALIERAGLEIVERGLYAFLPRNGLSRLPGFVSDSTGFARVLNRIDDALAGPGATICQNRYVVARRT
jgi:SAM-dependent methyltransferase